LAEIQKVQLRRVSSSSSSGMGSCGCEGKSEHRIYARAGRPHFKNDVDSHKTGPPLDDRIRSRPVERKRQTAGHLGCMAASAGLYTSGGYCATDNILERGARNVEPTHSGMWSPWTWKKSLLVWSLRSEENRPGAGKGECTRTGVF
jgi:hypothetical protein